MVLTRVSTTVPAVYVAINVDPATLAAVSNETVAQALRQSFATLLSVGIEFVFISAVHETLTGVTTTFLASAPLNLAGDPLGRNTTNDIIAALLGGNPAAAGARQLQARWGGSGDGTAARLRGVPPGIPIAAQLQHGELQLVRRLSLGLSSPPPAIASDPTRTDASVFFNIVAPTSDEARAYAAELQALSPADFSAALAPGISALASAQGLDPSAVSARLVSASAVALVDSRFAWVLVLPASVVAGVVGAAASLIVALVCLSAISLRLRLRARQSRRTLAKQHEDSRLHAIAHLRVRTFHARVRRALRGVPQWVAHHRAALIDAKKPPPVLCNVSHATEDGPLARATFAPHSTASPSPPYAMLDREPQVPTLALDDAGVGAREGTAWCEEASLSGKLDIVSNAASGGPGDLIASGAVTPAPASPPPPPAAPFLLARASGIVHHHALVEEALVLWIAGSHRVGTDYVDPSPAVRCNSTSGSPSAASPVQVHLSRASPQRLESLPGFMSGEQLDDVVDEPSNTAATLARAVEAFMVNSMATMLPGTVRSVPNSPRALTPLQAPTPLRAPSPPLPLLPSHAIPPLRSPEDSADAGATTDDDLARAVGEFLAEEDAPPTHFDAAHIEDARKYGVLVEDAQAEGSSGGAASPSVRRRAPALAPAQRLAAASVYAPSSNSGSRRNSPSRRRGWR